MRRPRSGSTGPCRRSSRSSRKPLANDHHLLAGGPRQKHDAVFRPGELQFPEQIVGIDLRTAFHDSCSTHVPSLQMFAQLTNVRPSRELNAIRRNER